MDFSFEASRARLVNSLRAKTSWAKFLPYSTNLRLVDSVAKEVDELARYDEYLTQETKWALARNRSSIVAEAAVRGYQPHRKIGATGIVWISSKEYAFADYWNNYTIYGEDDYVRLSDQSLYRAKQESTNIEPPNSVYWAPVSSVHQYVIGIPKYTQVQTDDELVFTTTQSTQLLTSENYTKLEVTQGTPQTFRTTATGDLFEKIFVNDDSMDDTFYEVFVNGNLYREVEDVRTEDADDRVFQVRNKLDYSGVEFMFGNGITGHKLNSGDEVVIKYTRTIGELGEVLGQGDIETVVSTLYDSKGNAIDMYCYNDESISGGKEYETVESIRANGKLAFQAGERVVSATDYEVYIQDIFDFVQRVVVWGAYEQNKDDGVDLWTWIDTNENLVYVSAFTTGATPTQLSDTQKIKIIEDITDRKPPLDIMIFQDVVFVNTKINTKAYIDNTGYLLPETKTRIQNAIFDKYNITNYDFEQDIYETSYKSFIQSIDGVHHHYTYFEFYNDTSFIDDYTTTTNLVMDPVKEKSVEVYVRNNTLEDSEWVLIGTDDEGDINNDGVGVISGETGYDLTGSELTYATGALYLNVASGLSDDFANYDIRIYYQTSERNLLLHGRNHIFYLRETSVEVEYY